MMRFFNPGTVFLEHCSMNTTKIQRFFVNSKTKTSCYKDTKGESFVKPETPQIVVEDCYQAKESMLDAQWLLRPYQGQPHPRKGSYNS